MFSTEWQYAKRLTNWQIVKSEGTVPKIAFISDSTYKFGEFTKPLSITQWSSYRTQCKLWYSWLEFIIGKGYILKSAIEGDSSGLVPEHFKYKSTTHNFRVLYLSDTCMWQYAEIIANQESSFQDLEYRAFTVVSLHRPGWCIAHIDWYHVTKNPTLNYMIGFPSMVEGTS